MILTIWPAVNTSLYNVVSEESSAINPSNSVFYDPFFESFICFPHVYVIFQVTTPVLKEWTTSWMHLYGKQSATVK